MLCLLEHSLWLSPGPSGCPFSGPFAGSSSSSPALSMGPVWGSLLPRICYSSLSPRESSSQATTNAQLRAGTPRRHISGLETQACTCTIESPADFREYLTVLPVFTTSPCLHSSPHFLDRIIIYLLLKTPAKQSLLISLSLRPNIPSRRVPPAFGLARTHRGAHRRPSLPPGFLLAFLEQRKC